MAESWRKRVEAYAGDTKRNKSEDFTARKLLRGLGWTERGLPLLCTALGLEYGPEVPTLTTVIDVLDSLSGGWFSPVSPYRKFILDVRDIPRSKSGWDNYAIQSMASMAGGMPMSHGVIVLSKVDDTAGGAKCVATVFMHDGGQTQNIPAWLLMPMSVLKARMADGFVSVWVRDAEELIRDMAKVHDWPIPERSAEDA